jgi:hypothetical protein
VIVIADAVPYLTYLQQVTAACFGWAGSIYTVFTSARARLEYKSLLLTSSRDLMMFNAELCYAGHSRRFTIDQAPLGGWELKIEEDHAVVSRVLYTDWHRVERALSAVTRRVSELEAGGWRSLASPEAAEETE